MATEADTPVRMTLGRIMGFCAVWLCTQVATASEPLTDADRAALENGDIVKREITYEDGDRKFVGGVAYAIINHPAEEVLRVLRTEASYRDLLPMTKEATVLRQEGKDLLVRMTHGNSLGSASYTCRIRQRAGDNLVRFWLDPRDPHDIDNAWGYFRVTAMGNRSLLTFAAAVDLGDGLMRMLFEERIRKRALRTPENVRELLEHLPANTAPASSASSVASSVP